MENNALIKLYENDFQAWIEQTILHVKNGQFESLDIENLLEELADLGRSERKALESNLMILIAHLLKLTVQKNVPESMKGSWYDSVVEHRQRIHKSLRDTPSLKNHLENPLIPMGEK